MTNETNVTPTPATCLPCTLRRKTLVSKKGEPYPVTELVFEDGSTEVVYDLGKASNVYKYHCKRKSKEV